MVYDVFLKLDGIPGESQVVGHVGEIEVHSLSWSEAQAIAGSATGSRVAVQDVVLVKRLDTSSPLLMQRCATGRRLKDASISFERLVGSTRFEFLRVTLTDVQVMSYAIDSGSDRELGVVDRSTLGFGRIVFRYTPQNADGTAGAAVTAGWDKITSRPV